ncbi:hypothetical protein DSO57_1001578 [Entomophthora muscae]|uniref:Uncharacterized protein n=1 Tax=Entomophthora muscae TaxID=34485 RepID=A0ACC2SAS5_9FUNG|nr:hypothetical protein DSO57_1001578 [Entomophthora muscae]
MESAQLISLTIYTSPTSARKTLQLRENLDPISKTTEPTIPILELGITLHKCGVPVHQSPKCVLDHSQGPAGRDCHSLVRGQNGLLFTCRRKIPLETFWYMAQGVKETIWICQYLESSNNILDSFYLVLDSCILVLDVCSLDLDSGAALMIQLLILGLHLSVYL